MGNCTVCGQWVPGPHENDAGEEIIYYCSFDCCAFNGLKGLDPYFDQATITIVVKPVVGVDTEVTAEV